MHVDGERVRRTAYGEAALGIALLSCRGQTCPAAEPWGPPHSVREVIADSRTSRALQGRDITVCGFLWVEDHGGTLWQDAEAFEGLRACLASPATCDERKNNVRLTLGGNHDKWRGFHNEEACVRGVSRAENTSNLAALALEISVTCARSP